MYSRPPKISACRLDCYCSVASTLGGTPLIRIFLFADKQPELTWYRLASREPSAAAAYTTRQTRRTTQTSYCKAFPYTYPRWTAALSNHPSRWNPIFASTTTSHPDQDRLIKEQTCCTIVAHAARAQVWDHLQTGKKTRSTCINTLCWNWDCCSFLNALKALKSGQRGSDNA